MFKRKWILFTSGLLTLLVVCSGWGFLVHRTINQLAICELPGSLREFFFHNQEDMVRNAPRPDIRRNTDATEATKHFIDFESYGDSAAWKMPMDWDAAVRRYSKDTLLKYGYLPYLILKVKDSLTAAFRSGNKDSILFYAADLGHYIGDAHVPLHTTINYDGQLTNQKGLHALWESTIPELNIEKYDLSSKHKASYLEHPDQAVWNALRESYVLVNDMLQKEKAVSDQFTDSAKYRSQMRRGKEVKNYSTAFANAYSQRLGNSVNQQLIKSVDLLSDFIYTGWVDAGRPDLEKLNAGFSREEKKAMKKTCRSFRKNNLIKDSLLLARKTNTNE